MPISAGSEGGSNVDALSRHTRLKEQIRAHRPALGLFVKIPAASVVEVLGGTGLDFVALDAEHAPFDMHALDSCILAARAAGIPALVRLPGPNRALVLQVLDMGAGGVIVSHIRSARDAEEVVAATRYSGGVRGFSASHRAAGYGAIPARVFLEKSDQSTIVIGQAEDAEAVTNIEAIAGVAGLDAIFIGPADLCVSLGAASWDEPIVEQAIERICSGCRRAGRATGMYLADSVDVERIREKGVSLFVISTDQALLAAAARALSKEFKASGA